MYPDPQTMRLVAELLANAARPDGEIRAADGRLYRKRSSPEAGVRTSLEIAEPGQPADRVATVYDPGSERPASYPSDLPFVPGTVALVYPAVQTVPPSAIVIWTESADPTGLERQVLELCQADGWEETAAPTPFAAGVSTPRELRRGPAKRLLTALPLRAESGVMLTQS
jgi:hypothetical protein